MQQRVAALQDGIAAQTEGAARLRTEVDDAFAAALAGVEEGMQDGSLLRGEVLARWHEFVGTGEVLRQLEQHVGRARDRITSYFQGRGKAQPAENLGEALQSGVVVLVRSHGEAAVDTVSRGWRSTSGGAPLVSASPDLTRLSADFTARAERLVRSWQGDVLQMVRDEAAGKRTTARFLAFGVNGLAVMLMLIAFSANYGLSGAEVGIAGGSAVLAQRLLEALFGDQAVRSLSIKARKKLLAAADDLYEQEKSRYVQVLDAGVAPAGGGDSLAGVLRDLKAARR